MMAPFLVCLLAGLLPALAPPTSAPESVKCQGKVLTLSEALAARDLGIKADSELNLKQVVLLAADGAITPILADDASRALFLDDRLRKCPSEIQGRRFAGLPYIQIISFKVEHDGELQTPFYYCDVCAINVRYPQICPCCQGPMELRFRPDKQ